MIRRIKVCVNGGRSAGVPVTPAQLAAEAAAAVAAGAEAVHLHPRGPDGAETLTAPAVGAAVAAVRESCPGVPISVTTGLWITGGDPARRLELVRAWAELPAPHRPDLASVNLGEDRFADTVAVLERAGVAVEAGVWSEQDARRLGATPVEKILVEVVQTPATEAVGVADRLLARLDREGAGAPRLLHGEEEACWPLIRHAGRLGLPTRIGLEDTLADDTGAPAGGNAALVRRALAVWESERAAGQVQ
ncbi:3-keto-5-aminohexanoate cleavage protein [Actinoplanes sp. N902-109]|uniref:3-keto-5-aminohexanoate cleavage protein n=1 Tax=Actinoplanes sp. (strain N902-109) TaxID=649831 RepID=UPI00032964DD|nr:3-keto-5-aminohexanoate cleavage protein [Actinoplanes sp. N902-109]AGL17354.1 hypothetical protein L083_3844 [Actinoplanes sp. N902-109]